MRERGWSPADLNSVLVRSRRSSPARRRHRCDYTALVLQRLLFAGFRRFLLRESALRSIHVFDARDKAFSEDGVLQETVVTHSVRGATPGTVELALSHQPGSVAMQRTVPLRTLFANDRDAFIRLPVNEDGEVVREWMSHLHHSLADLGIKVSTGPVVDFRARENLRAEFEPGLVPLLYPTHLADGGIPGQDPGVGSRMRSCDGAEKLLTLDGHYTIVKRFSAKEERRRVVASYYDGSLGHPVGSYDDSALDLSVPIDKPSAIALENHLNYFHQGWAGP